MAETIDQEFIEYIVKTLVGKPDEVKIRRTIDERGVLLELYVDPEDLGRVIGRNGATAKSIRTLLRALGVKNDARYNLKIVDTNSDGRPAPAGEDKKPAEKEEPTDTEETAEESTEEPAETPAEAPKPEESDLDKKRKEIEDITGGLDI